MTERFFALTDRGRRKPTNQDAVAVRALDGGYTLMVVADGVGGGRGGETASSETVNAIVGDLSYLGVPDPAGSLRRAIKIANRRVCDMARSQEQLSGMATTVVVALVKGQHAWIASVGDSRAYLCGRAGLAALTEDDSWVAEQVRAGLLSPDEAAHSPYQNVITKGIGVEDSLSIERIVETCIGSGDVLLLCSDGLYRAVSPAMVAETVADGALDAVAARLVTLANEAGGPDNIGIALHRG